MKNYNSSQTTKAIALGYDQETDKAPKILASGQDLIAQKILDIAKEHNIPIHRDGDLAQILSLLAINSYIPLEVYGAIAKIISYIYAQDNLKKQAKHSLHHDPE